MISRLRKINLKQAVFLSAALLVFASGLYLLSFRGIDFGWIGIFMIVGGLGSFLFFSDAVSRRGD